MSDPIPDDNGKGVSGGNSVTRRKSLSSMDVESKKDLDDDGKPRRTGNCVSVIQLSFCNSIVL